MEGVEIGESEDSEDNVVLVEEKGEMAEEYLFSLEP